MIEISDDRVLKEFNRLNEETSTYASPLKTYDSIAMFYGLRTIAHALILGFTCISSAIKESRS